MIRPPFLVLVPTLPVMAVLARASSSAAEARARATASSSSTTGGDYYPLSRLPDYRANLVARRFMTAAERETYVRHNSARCVPPTHPRACGGCSSAAYTSSNTSGPGSART